MAFPPHVHPGNVGAPQQRLDHRHVLIAGTRWSLAVGRWDRSTKEILIRWNDEPASPRGNPVSYGHPTWFVLPEAFHEAALSEAEKIDHVKAEKARQWLAIKVEWPPADDASMPAHEQ